MRPRELRLLLFHYHGLQLLNCDRNSGRPKALRVGRACNSVTGWRSDCGL
jgi:hypothetical protein